MPRPRGKNVEYDTYMTPDQRHLYNQIAKRAEAYRDARTNGYARMMERLNAETAVMKVQMEAAVLDAWEPYERGETPKRGLKIATIGRAMGTSDWKTLKDITDQWNPELHRTPEEFTLHLDSWNAEERTGEFTLHFTTIDGVEFTEDSFCKVNHEDGWWAYPVGMTSPMERALTAWRGSEAAKWQADLGERVGTAFEGIQA